MVRVHPEGPDRRGSWRNRQTRHVQTVQIGVRIPASRPSQHVGSSPPLGPFRGGHSRRERRRVVSAGVRVRVPLSSPEWARRSTGGSLVCTQEMRVRFPPSPPTNVCCGGKGRRPWRSHKPRHAGSIPASATTAGSFNGRTAVLQAAHGGSIPSPATNFCCEGSVTASTGGCGPPSRVRVPPSPHFSFIVIPQGFSGRRVIGSPPASGAGAWRFDSSRPDHWQIVQRQDRGL